MKIDEIINKHYDTIYADYGMKLSEVKAAMKEYAEIYAKRCLKESRRFEMESAITAWCNNDSLPITLPNHE